MEGRRGGRDFICQVGEFQLLYVHQFTVAAVSTLRRFPIPDAAEQKRAADACLDAGRGDLILKSTFDTWERKAARGNASGTVYNGNNKRYRGFVGVSRWRR